MEVVIYIVGILLVAIWLWLNILATIAARRDPTLEPVQRNGQTVLVWLFPFVGATFILHLVFEHYPNAIPKAWIPWPFKKIVYGKNHKENRNRDEDESPAINSTINRNRGSSGNEEAGNWDD